MNNQSLRGILCKASFFFQIDGQIGQKWSLTFQACLWTIYCIIEHTRSMLVCYKKNVFYTNITMFFKWLLQCDIGSVFFLLSWAFLYLFYQIFMYYNESLFLIKTNCLHVYTSMLWYNMKTNCAFVIANWKAICHRFAFPSF